ncbi:helix-turn-helix domain-containing protein [Streptomyces sp. NPDC057638]|uniref:helix-turn-helix domain-containing protein n=1 Tax=Streptomyces sp. NPDC057638 TaxID=3346190 RepID=UPI00367A506E
MTARYEERPAALPGAVLWRAVGAGGPVLPDGCMDLLWTPGQLLVAGPDTRAHRTPPGTPYAGLRLPPGAAPALLGVPAHELRDRRVPLADLWGERRTRPLAARVDAAPDPAAALEALALTLAAVPDGAPDPRTAEIVRLLAAGATVASAASTVGLGARQLHRRSLHAFGYGPKTLARILRLQHALALLHQGRPLATAAAVSGYADQPHLARETRALTGITLTAYRVSRGLG